MFRIFRYILGWFERLFRKPRRPVEFERFPVTIDDDGRKRVHLYKQLIVGTRDEFKQVVLSHLELGENSLVIDCSECMYVDSSGLGTLVYVLSKVREKGCRLELEGMSDNLILLLELSKLDGEFGLKNDVPA